MPDPPWFACGRLTLPVTFVVIVPDLGRHAVPQNGLDLAAACGRLAVVGRAWSAGRGRPGQRHRWPSGAAGAAPEGQRCGTGRACESARDLGPTVVPAVPVVPVRLRALTRSKFRDGIDSRAMTRKSCSNRLPASAPGRDDHPQAGPRAERFGYEHASHRAAEHGLWRAGPPRSQAGQADPGRPGSRLRPHPGQLAWASDSATTAAGAPVSRPAPAPGQAQSRAQSACRDPRRPQPRAGACAQPVLASQPVLVSRPGPVSPVAAVSGHTH